MGKLLNWVKGFDVFYLCLHKTISIFEALYFLILAFISWHKKFVFRRKLYSRFMKVSNTVLHKVTPEA